MSKLIINLSIFLIFVCITLIHSQTLKRLAADDPCITKTTCRECIQTQSCVWCMKADFQDKPRCFEPSRAPLLECHNETYEPATYEHVVWGAALTKGKYESSMSGGTLVHGSSSSSSSSSHHSSSFANSTQESSSSSGSSSASGSSKITQIYPQRVKLALRANQKHRLKISYSQAEDYPVDLYYLMDLSKSMEDDKEKLSHLGDLLASTMKNITSNFRLGFGSFVDKVLMPYVSTVPKKLKQPCDGCEAPYGYRNHMPLDIDTTRFSREVKDAAVSGNLDAPEGGFDAIMQAVVCRKEIAWRDQARHLLVFSTDAGFHYAGDGKLGGVITPNDGICHLDNKGMYTHSTIQDYPSISQINLNVKQNAINVIFAVTAQEYDVYKKLSNHVEGSSCAVLSEDSSNVVTLVEQEYSKISSSVELRHDNLSSAVQVTYYSACLNGDKLVQTNKCDGLKVGDVVEFTAEILVTHCPQNPSEWHQQFPIYPIGINESLIVDLEILCDCPCEKYGIAKSPNCGYHGTYKCGICECDPQFFGRQCECSITDISTESSGGCRATNETLVDCNGRGTCVCGICECEKRADTTEVIRGKFCECDNFSCDRHNDVVCSGPSNGVCECGTCRCFDGWSGSACECRSTTDTCRTDGIKDICSGHGDCVCGECRCHATDEGRYSGQYCEKCPTCAGRCTELKDCVQCQMYETGPLKGEECMKNCSTLFTPIEAETIVVDEDQDEHLCVFYDEDDCKYQFVYSEKEPNTLRVRAQKERECPPKVFIIGIVLAVIAAIVLIGLAILLLWKLLTTIHDRREFARFEKERMMAKWDTGENPIYKQATSTFKNPTYAGK